MGLKFYILCFLCCGQFMCSQNDSIQKNEYITTFQDKISTRISLVNTSNNFYINEFANGLNYKLEPNIRSYLRFSVLFRSIEIDYGFAPKFIKSNEDNENSILFNLNFRMFRNQWMQTIDIYKQKGFKTIVEDECINFPELKTLKVGGSTAYILNKNFSFRAIGYQNEWQTKSAGSFIPRLYYYYYTKYSVNIDEFNENASSFDITIAPSYYYNLVIKKNFLVGLGSSVGIGLNHSSNIGEGKLTSALYEFSGRAVVGYNSKTFYGGVNSNLLIMA